MTSYSSIRLVKLLKFTALNNGQLFTVIERQFCKSSAYAKNIRAGQPKISIRQNKPLTYEESQFPYLIGVTKSWNSWNTSTLHEEGHTSEITMEDLFIRKFMVGTWPQLLMSEVIIKRRHNLIVIAAVISQKILPRKVYFLQGYTEEILSYILKCQIKLEIQTVTDKNDVVFKYI